MMIFIIIIGVVLFLRNKQNSEVRIAPMQIEGIILPVQKKESTANGNLLAVINEQKQINDCLNDVSPEVVKNELNMENSEAYREYTVCKAIETNDVRQCDDFKSINNELYITCISNIINFAYFNKIAEDEKCPRNFCSNDALLKEVGMMKGDCKLACDAIAEGNVVKCEKLTSANMQKECSLVLGVGIEYCDKFSGDEKKACLGDYYLIDFFKKKDQLALEKIKQVSGWETVYVQGGRYLLNENCDDYFQKILKKEYCNLAL